MYPFINHNQNDVISKMFWKNLHTLFYTLDNEGHFLKNVVSMADVYGNTIDDVISNLETFNPE